MVGKGGAVEGEGSGEGDGGRVSLTVRYIAKEPGFHKFVFSWIVFLLPGMMRP